MPTSRNNHYVPQWYQEGFFEPGRNTLARLDLSPEQHRLPNGKSVPGRAVFDSPTSRCFSQMDLYSTFFRSIVNNEIIVNDEIERMLFGAIDAAAAPAVRAFQSDDPNEWMRHFETLFRYLDIQKIRTPKGLDWLRAQHPNLSQNELMEEMQGIQMMNCTVWTEGVREIVSAEDADVKFITTDHPVTVYNPAFPLSARKLGDQSEAPIALKGSQTLFPMNRNQCLILTNLEYARDSMEDPTQRRTFARNYRSSMVRTDAFIRSRCLTSDEVIQINAILKAGARRYVAAGRKEWLYPEKQAQSVWKDLGTILRPPKNGLYLFGGEIMAKSEDGTVRFQDEFGRAERPTPALLKSPTPIPNPKDLCGCGSDKLFRICCESRPAHLRPSWAELSIRERNLILYRAILDILGMKEGKDWNAVRRDLTDEQIANIYTVYASLWPTETDLLSLLPKPDGRPRAVYTGSIHPSLIKDFAVGAALYFGEVIIENTFVNARAVHKEFSPVYNPQIYRQEILKSLVLFFALIPLVAAGLVNLIPDPGNFDLHLRD